MLSKIPRWGKHADVGCREAVPNMFLGELRDL
jgi:hypothetical protein